MASPGRSPRRGRRPIGRRPQAQARTGGRPVSPETYTQRWRRPGPVLHEEIDRLPERFRVPVILCDLEGSTHEQAARHLGWPVGTVKSRLTRGRERLRDRLVRRGLAPSAGLLAVAMRPAGLEELVPAGLVSSTTSAAVRFAASRTILGGSAAILAQGVLTAMSMTRWWKVASMLLVAGATVSGLGVLAWTGASAVEPRPQAAAKAGAGAGSDTPVAEVNLGKFKVSVTGPGSLEPERDNDVICQVEGRRRSSRSGPTGPRSRRASSSASSTRLRFAPS